jgi:hypothetical protein
MADRLGDEAEQEVAVDDHEGDDDDLANEDEREESDESNADGQDDES